ncbi:MAG: CoA pyrophosphatase [Chloroflexi bacterium]|nr:CoA pyrophosphatase [Chloroflexota bacterium]
MADPFHRDLDAQAIRTALAAAQQKPPVDPYPAHWFAAPAKPAAVLVPLLQADDGWRLLFIRRATNEHDPHSGQVAFPGGQQEPADPNPEATALREAEEEIGLHPSHVTLWGRLPRHRTLTNFSIVPVVGQVPWPLDLRLAQEEVTHIFTVPLAWLRQPEHWDVRVRRLKTGEEARLVYFRPYQGEVIWGATARIVVTLLQVLGWWPEGAEAKKV